MTRIAAFGGSLRKNAYNAHLLIAAAELAPAVERGFAHAAA